MTLKKLKNVRFKEAVDKPITRDGRKIGNGMFFTSEDVPGTPGYDISTEQGWVFIVDRYSGDMVASPVHNVIQSKPLADKKAEAA